MTIITYGIFAIKDDWGAPVDDPVGFVKVEVEEKSNWVRWARNKARADYAKRTGNKEYVTGCYTAIPVSSEEKQRQITKLRRKLDIWEDWNEC